MKVNYRQVSILVFMSFIALKFLALPSLLYTECKNMSWMVELTLMLIDGIYAVLILNLAKKNENKNIYEFMTQTLGKFLTKVFLLFLILKYALVIVNIVKGLEFFVVDNLYEEFNWVLFIAPMIAVVGFIIYKGIRNVARLSEMFIWAVVVACLYIAVKSFSAVDVLEFLPLFKVDAITLISNGYKHLSWFGSSTFLLMLFGSIDFKDNKKWTVIKFGLFAILLVQLIYFVFYGLFGVTSSAHNFGISDIGQNFTTYSAISELSWLVVSIWIVAQAIQIAMYGYSFIQTIKFFFDINSNIIPILIFDILLIAWGYLGKAIPNLENIFFSQFASIITIVAAYIIPIVLLIADKIKNKRRVKHEKVENNI